MTHPQGVAKLDPGVWLAGFMQGPSYIAHAKYISCGPNGYREDFFKSFFFHKSIETLESLGGASLDPRG